MIRGSYEVIQPKNGKRNIAKVGDSVVVLENGLSVEKGTKGIIKGLTQFYVVVELEDTDIKYFMYYEVAVVFDLDEEEPKPMTNKSTGGPTAYYDMPFSEWTTTNDMMEYLAEHKWGFYGIHLKDIFKALCRWGEKSGTDTQYDTKKIIYYGCRCLALMIGKPATMAYLKELMEDPQFQVKGAK